MFRSVGRFVWSSSVGRQTTNLPATSRQVLVIRAMCDLEDGMETVTVNVGQGALRGRKVISRPGTAYYSFQGIPYAKPPVGSRRFKSPEPLDPWRGERDSLEEGSMCIHFDMFMKQLRGVEDCLFLNVYTPQASLPTGFVSSRVRGNACLAYAFHFEIDTCEFTLPDGGSTALKAVMVWIHGGGFTTGSGNTDLYGPDYFVHADVILVTFNYRLGALGFLCLNDTNVSANNGLKDQVAVLQWVQQNIAQFGGDPDNVTIFGESAGSACVHYHLLSPMSKGLFHRAIAQSGSVLNPWAFIESSRTRAFRLGELLGCKTDDAEELVRFLRSVPAKSIVEAQENTLTLEEKTDGLVFPFLPEVESEGPQNFLPKKPLELIKAGSIHEVPLIMGMNSHEGLVALQILGKDQVKALNRVGKNFDRFVPEDLADKNSTRSAEISNKIRQLYFKDEPVSERTLPQYINLMTDTMFGAGIYRAVKEHVTSCKAPLYYYQFAFDGQLGIFKRMVPRAQEVSWLPVTESDVHCLTIDNPPRTGTDPHKDRASLWTELYSDATLTRQG
uniref:Carboxylic ester hydrolase n=1 Tax=Timema tahoe TaxID=61484 RepID=A0A7R9NWF7_9NEOP|nr:unnamed protein product [Timema tahoe]